MKNVSIILVAMLFVLLGTSLSFAQIYNNNGSIYSNSSNTSIYSNNGSIQLRNNNNTGLFQNRGDTSLNSRSFNSSRRSGYASTASPYKNPYPNAKTDEELAKISANIYRRQASKKAPTGNYPRRAFMPNR